MERFVSAERDTGQNQIFSIPQNIPEHSFAYGGAWTVENEQSIAGKNAVLEFNFYANKAFLVITPKNGGGSVRVLLDGKPVDATFAGADVTNSIIILDTPRLYELIDLKGKRDWHRLRLEFDTEGTSVYAFTFG